MSPTALKRVALAFFVLLLAWGAFKLLGERSSDEIAGLNLPQLNIADVDRITLQRASDTVDLVKTAAGDWTVNGHAASASAVEDWLAALADASAGSGLAARSATSHARMGVDSVKGRRVQFLSGDRTLVDLVVGNRGRVGTGYVRPAETDEVYQIRGALPRLADRGVNDWRDRRIAKVPSDSIGRVDVTRRAGRYTLLRTEEHTWTIDGAPADSTTVARLVGALRDLQASGFPTDSQLGEIAFDDPYRRLRILDASGVELLSLVFDSTAAGTWARRAGGGGGGGGGPVYRLDWWRVNGLTPADSTVRGGA